MNRFLDHTRRPDITFYRSGQIRIASRVARRLHIRPGDSINIASANGEYLLFAIHHTDCLGRHQATCYRCNKTGESYCANSAQLCRTLYNAVGLSGRKIAFMTGEPIASGEIIYIPIVTNRPL